MVGWPGSTADLTFLVGAQGVSGSVAIEPCLGYLVFQLLELKILERFREAGPLERPAQDRISFSSQLILKHADLSN